MIPQLSSFADVITKADEITKYVKDHPLDDLVYHLKADAAAAKCDFTKDKQLDCVIAGSKAVTLVRAELKWAESQRIEKLKLSNRQDIKTFVEQCGEKDSFLTRTNVLFMCWKFDQFCDQQRREFHGQFEANDTDMFILNAETKKRFDLNGIDIIYIKHPTADDLILDFDLPCCRAARDLQNNFTVSLQCLASLLNGVVYVPHYLKTKELYDQIVGKQRRVCFDKVKFRQDKYISRGYAMEYVETDTVLNCLLRPFYY